MTEAQRMRVAEIPLADISPRFEVGRGASGVDFVVERRAWFAVQRALHQRLQPLFDDGWVVVPSSLGPHSLHIQAEREDVASGFPVLNLLRRNDTLFVRSATVLLQRPVHFAEDDCPLKAQASSDRRVLA